mgnify:CR=1 FL=1
MKTCDKCGVGFNGINCPLCLIVRIANKDIKELQEKIERLEAEAGRVERYSDESVR